MKKKEGSVLIIDDNEELLLALSLYLSPHFREIRTENSPKLIPTLLERDFNIPPLPELLTEVDRIASIQTKHQQNHDKLAQQA